MTLVIELDSGILKKYAVLKAKKKKNIEMNN